MQSLVNRFGMALLGHRNVDTQDRLRKCIRCTRHKAIGDNLKLLNKTIMLVDLAIMVQVLPYYR